jgi:hypothetical protein
MVTNTEFRQNALYAAMDLDSSVESVSSPRFDAFLAGVADHVTVVAYGGNKNYYVHLDPETGEVTDIVEE